MTTVFAIPGTDVDLRTPFHTHFHAPEGWGIRVENHTKLLTIGQPPDWYYCYTCKNGLKAWTGREGMDRANLLELDVFDDFTITFTPKVNYGALSLKIDLRHKS